MQLGFQVVSRAFYYDSRVTEKIRSCINVQKSFSLTVISQIFGAAPKKNDDLISG